MFDLRSLLKTPEVVRAPIILSMGLTPGLNLQMDHSFPDWPKNPFLNLGSKPALINEDLPEPEGPVKVINLFF